MRESIESEEDMIERIRILMRDLREFSKVNPEGTVLMISHGCFLKSLMLFLTNQHDTMKESTFQSSNNALTIIDFETKENNYVTS